MTLDEAKEELKDFIQSLICFRCHGIRITYDYDRDGWSIMQPIKLCWAADDEVCDMGWRETAFVQSWHFDKEQKEHEESLHG